MTDTTDPTTMDNATNESYSQTPISRRNMLKAVGAAGATYALSGSAYAQDDGETLDMTLYTSKKQFDSSKVRTGDGLHFAKLTETNMAPVMEQYVEASDEYSDWEITVSKDPKELEMSEYGILPRLIEFNGRVDDFDDASDHVNQYLDSNFGDSTVGVAFVDEESPVNGRGNNACVTDYGQSTHTLNKDELIGQAPIIEDDELTDFGYFAAHAALHEPVHCLMGMHSEGTAWREQMDSTGNDTRVMASIIMSGYAPNIQEGMRNACNDELAAIDVEQSSFGSTFNEDLWLDYSVSDCVLQNFMTEARDAHENHVHPGPQPAVDALEEYLDQKQLERDNEESDVDLLEKADQLREQAESELPVATYDVAEIPKLQDKFPFMNN